MSFVVMPVFAASGENDEEKLIVGIPVDRCPIFYVDTESGEAVGMLRSLSGAIETLGQLYPGMEIIAYETMSDSVEALRAGEVDALLHNSYNWSYVLQKPSYSDLVVQPSTVFSMDFRAGTLDTPEGRATIERLNEGIAKLDDIHRQAIILDYTSRKLYHNDFADYLYQYGLVFFIMRVLDGDMILR